MSDVTAQTHRFHLTERLTLRQKRAIEAASEEHQFIESLHICKNWRIVEFKLSDAAANMVNLSNALKAFLGDKGAVVDYELQARKAA